MGPQTPQQTNRTQNNKWKASRERAMTAGVTHWITCGHLVIPFDRYLAALSRRMTNLHSILEQRFNAGVNLLAH
jgi:hypothetical protein